MFEEVKNYNKHGNIRTRVIPWPNGKAFGINPSGLGGYIGVRTFRYDYKHPFQPPSLLTLNGKTYIMPLWKEVISGTTLKDINWIKPIVKKTTTESFKFTSSSSDKIYSTIKTTLASGEIKLSCNCPGTWRAKDRRCKHIKSLE